MSRSSCIMSKIKAFAMQDGQTMASQIYKTDNIDPHSAPIDENFFSSRSVTRQGCMLCSQLCTDIKVTPLFDVSNAIRVLMSTLC